MADQYLINMTPVGSYPYQTATLSQILDGQYGTNSALLHRDAQKGWITKPTNSNLVPVVLTFTGGGIPAAYNAATGALTVANSAAPTSVELLAYCNELRGNITQLLSILQTHGIHV